MLSGASHPIPIKIWNFTYLYREMISDDKCLNIFPYLVVDCGRWIPWLNSNNGGVNFWWWYKLGTLHLHQMLHLSQQLNTDRKSAINFATGFGEKPIGKLFLEHQHRISYQIKIELISKSMFLKRKF